MFRRIRERDVLEILSVKNNAMAVLDLRDALDEHYQDCETSKLYAMFGRPSSVDVHRKLDRLEARGFVTTRSEQISQNMVTRSFRPVSVVTITTDGRRRLEVLRKQATEPFWRRVWLGLQSFRLSFIRLPFPTHMGNED